MDGARPKPESHLGRLLICLVFVFGVTITGTTGYHLLEGWSWGQSLYMTVITISTVGFGEVEPLSAAGRLFTVGLIVVGVGTVAFALSSVLELLFVRSFQRLLEKSTMKNEIQRMKQHVLVCGYGKMGRLVARDLHAEDWDTVVIDHDEARVREAEQSGLPCLNGDATDEELLEQAGIDRAAVLVATLDDDAENLFLTLTARGMNPKLRIIARVEDQRSARKFERAGVNQTVTPQVAGAGRILQLITRPGVVDLIELVTRAGKFALRVCETPIESDSPHAGKTLSEARIRQTLGHLVLAIKRADGSTDFDPRPNERIEVGDTLVSIERPQQPLQEP